MEQFANDLQKQFHFDAINGLLAMKNEAITYFVQRNFLCKRVEPIQSIWQLKEVKTLLQKQQDDGSWNNPGKKIHQYPSHHYPLLETWKRFRILVNQYQFNKQQIPIKKAAEFLFSCQTDTGDFRGMIGDQYVTYYTGAFLAALIRSGYSADDRIEKGFKWLLSMRQNDGGWTIPILTTHLIEKPVII